MTDETHLCEVIADSLDREVATALDGVASSGWPLDTWRVGEHLVRATAQGVRGDCHWRPGDHMVIGQEAGALVSAGLVAAAALRDYRDEGRSWDGLLMLHHDFAAFARSPIEHNGAVYDDLAHDDEWVENALDPDPAAHAMGVPVRISGEALQQALDIYRSALRLGCAHLQGDAAYAMNELGDASRHDAAHMALHGLVRLMDFGTPGEVAALGELRASMAAWGTALAVRISGAPASHRPLLDATVSHLMTGSPRPRPIELGESAVFQWLDHAYALLDDEASQPGAGLPFLDTIAIEGLRMHARIMAAIPDEWIATGRAKRLLVFPALPDLPTRNMELDIIACDNQLTAMRAAHTYAHALQLVADALAGSAASEPPGDVREALQFAARTAEQRGRQVIAPWLVASPSA